MARWMLWWEISLGCLLYSWLGRNHTLLGTGTLGHQRYDSETRHMCDMWMDKPCPHIAMLDFGMYWKQVITLKVFSLYLSLPSHSHINLFLCLTIAYNPAWLSCPPCMLHRCSDRGIEMAQHICLHPLDSLEHPMSSQLLYASLPCNDR